MQTEYPLNFDVRLGNRKSYMVRMLGFIPLLAVTAAMWRRDPDHAVAFIWFAGLMLAAVLVGMLVVWIKNRRNFSKPKFSLYRDKLLVKGAFANIIEYPVEAFENEVIIRKRLFEQFIEVPDMRPIHISCLAPPDRNKLIDALTLLVEHRPPD